jgi:hypothetical protein
MGHSKEGKTEALAPHLLFQLLSSTRYTSKLQQAFGLGSPQYWTTKYISEAEHRISGSRIVYGCISPDVRYESSIPAFSVPGLLLAKVPIGSQQQHWIIAHHTKSTLYLPSYNSSIMTVSYSKLTFPRLRLFKWIPSNRRFHIRIIQDISLYSNHDSSIFRHATSPHINQFHW